MDNLHENQIVAGVVVAVSQQEAWVDIGYKQEIPIPKRELARPEPESAEDVVQVGDEIDVYIVFLDGERCVLSKVKAESMNALKHIEKIKERGDAVQAKITQVVKGGLVASVNGLRGFIPSSQMGLHFVSDLSSYVGQTVDVIPIEVDPPKQRMVLSRRIYLEREQKRQESERKKEKEHQIQMAQEKNPFLLKHFLPSHESVISKLTIYDSNISFYVTSNWLLVTGKGLKEIFNLRHLTHVSLYWYDADSADDNTFVYGDSRNKIALDIFDTSRNCWRFYIPEDLSEDVTKFVRSLLGHESIVENLRLDAPLKSDEPKIIVNEIDNDDKWN